MSNLASDPTNESQEPNEDSILWVFRLCFILEAIRTQKVACIASNWNAEKLKSWFDRKLSTNVVPTKQFLMNLRTLKQNLWHVNESKNISSYAIVAPLDSIIPTNFLLRTFGDSKSQADAVDLLKEALSMPQETNGATIELPFLLYPILLEVEKLLVENTGKLASVVSFDEIDGMVSSAKIQEHTRFDNLKQIFELVLKEEYGHNGQYLIDVRVLEQHITKIWSHEKPSYSNQSVDVKAELLSERAFQILLRRLRKKQVVSMKTFLGLAFASNFFHQIERDALRRVTLSLLEILDGDTENKRRMENTNIFDVHFILTTLRLSRSLFLCQISELKDAIGWCKASEILLSPKSSNPQSFEAANRVVSIAANAERVTMGICGFGEPEMPLDYAKTLKLLFVRNYRFLLLPGVVEQIENEYMALSNMEAKRPQNKRQGKQKVPKSRSNSPDDLFSVAVKNVLLSCENRMMEAFGSTYELQERVKGSLDIDVFEVVLDGNWSSQIEGVCLSRNRDVASATTQLAWNSYLQLLCCPKLSQILKTLTTVTGPQSAPCTQASGALLWVKYAKDFAFESSLKQLYNSMDSSTIRSMNSFQDACFTEELFGTVAGHQELFFLHTNVPEALESVTSITLETLKQWHRIQQTNIRTATWKSLCDLAVQMDCNQSKREISLQFYQVLDCALSDGQNDSTFGNEIDYFVGPIPLKVEEFLALFSSTLAMLGLFLPNRRNRFLSRVLLSAVDCSGGMGWLSIRGLIAIYADEMLRRNQDIRESVAVIDRIQKNDLLTNRKLVKKLISIQELIEEALQKGFDLNTGVSDILRLAWYVARTGKVKGKVGYLLSGLNCLLEDTLETSSISVIHERVHDIAVYLLTYSVTVVECNWSKLVLTAACQLGDLNTTSTAEILGVVYSLFRADFACEILDLDRFRQSIKRSKGESTNVDQVMELLLPLPQHSKKLNSVKRQEIEQTAEILYQAVENVKQWLQEQCNINEDQLDGAICELFTLTPSSWEKRYLPSVPVRISQAFALNQILTATTFLCIKNTEEYLHRTFSNSEVNKPLGSLLLVLQEVSHYPEVRTAEDKLN